MSQSRPLARRLIYSAGALGVCLSLFVGGALYTYTMPYGQRLDRIESEIVEAVNLSPGAVPVQQGSSLSLGGMILALGLVATYGVVRSAMQPRKISPHR